MVGHDQHSICTETSQVKDQEGRFKTKVNEPYPSNMFPQSMDDCNRVIGGFEIARELHHNTACVRKRPLTERS